VLRSTEYSSCYTWQKKLILGWKIVEGHLSSPLHPQSLKLRLLKNPSSSDICDCKWPQEYDPEASQSHRVSHINVSLNMEIGQGDTTCSSFELLFIFIRFVVLKIKNSGLKYACANPENDESVRSSKLGR
jgi:hypothetical protein